MAITTFTQIEAWDFAHRVVLAIYEITKSFPGYELYGLTSQIKRAAYSVPTNITEGFNRNSKKESLHFYSIARASLEEVKYFLILAKDLKYLPSEKYSKTMCFAEETGRILHGWITSQKQLMI